MTDHRTTIVAEGYDALGADYLAWASGFADPPRHRMLNEFSARLASGARVLDLGCGPGLPSTQTLASRFAVTGVDISEAQLEAARRNVPRASFLQADLAEVDFPPESFDGVTAFYSISHVPRDQQGPLFERVARWLVPGGLFLATLGSGDDPDWIGEWLGRPMFFSSYDADANRRLLRAANFELLIDEIIETPEPEGPVPFLWVLAQRGPEKPRADVGQRVQAHEGPHSGKETGVAVPATVEDYLAALPDDRRAAMDELRQTINAAAPEATESIAYGMPALRSHGGQFLVSYAAYKNHYSLFPASDAVVERLGDELTPYLAGRGTIRFPASRPIPIATVTKILKIRLEENAAHKG